MLSALVGEPADKLFSTCVSNPENPAEFPFIAESVELDNNPKNRFDIHYTYVDHNYSQTAVKMVQEGATIVPFLCENLLDSRASKLSVGGLIYKYFDGEGTPGDKRYPYDEYVIMEPTTILSQRVIYAISYLDKSLIANLAFNGNQCSRVNM